MPSSCRAVLLPAAIHTVWVAVGLLGCGSETSKSVESGAGGGEIDSGDTAVNSCGPAVPVDVRGCLELREDDPEGDARWPALTRIQYDAEGRELSRDVRGGEAVDTEVVCRTSWDGDLRTEERCAGASSYRYAYTYDSSGHPVGKTYDADDDGSIDRRWVYVTDSDGQVVEATTDDDDDGSLDAVQTFVWDAAGRLVEEAWDYTFDGVVDYRRTLVWSDGNFGAGTVSEDGLLMEESEDFDGDGAIDRQTVWAYDELDRPILQQRFENGSSTPAETVEWRYAGCLLDVVTTSDAGGSRTDVSWVFDAQGRPHYQIEDWDEDGRPDRLQATTWVCPGE